MILAEPKVSTDKRFFTRPFSLLILETPIDKITVVKAIKPSGIAATANEIPVIKAFV
ncbi:UNVERIFIED_CONTAM: hypothetical protein O8I53_08515 [Campylobacter lari]